MLKKTVLFLTFLSLSQIAYSAEYSGKVKGFYINNISTALLSLSDGASQPECESGVWQFTFNVETESSAKEWVSMILASKATGSTLKVGYTPDTSARCSIQYLYFLD